MSTSLHNLPLIKISLTPTILMFSLNLAYINIPINHSFENIMSMKLYTTCYWSYRKVFRMVIDWPEDSVLNPDNSYTFAIDPTILELFFYFVKNLFRSHILRFSTKILTKCCVLPFQSQPDLTFTKHFMDFGVPPW